MDEEQPDIRHVMVVTLKSGVQIRVGVKSYEASRSRARGNITDLRWEPDDDPLGTSIGYLDLGEVASVHSEREPRRKALERIPLSAKTRP